MESKDITYDLIKEIYDEEYIKNRLGTPTLKKKYGFDVASKFYKYGFKLRNHREKNKKYFCDSEYFKEINTEEKAYWLGFMMGDGYISSPTVDSKYKRFGVSIKQSDYNHLVKFRNAIQSNVPINEYEVTQSGYKIGTKYCRIILSDHVFADYIMQQGCVEHKSNILQPPNILQELERHWIRGYMDANGSIAITKPSKTNSKPSYEIKFIGTDVVLNWIMDVLIRDNIIKRKYPMYKRKPNQIVSCFEFGGNYLSQKYLDYIYKDATVWLDRKYDRYIQLLQINKEKDYKYKSPIKE